MELLAQPEVTVVCDVQMEVEGNETALVFSAQIPGDKEFVSWQPDLEESVKPSQQARPTVIRWADGGKEVFISGSFNNWSTKIPLIKR